MDTESGPIVYHNPGERDKAVELLDSGIEGSCSTYATTNANSSEVFSMESMRAAYQKMKDMKPIPIVVDGKEVGEVTEIVVSDRSLLASMKLQNSDKSVRSSAPFNIPAFSVPIRVDASIPETWVPPESGSPHFSYGPEDESWMRPLGLEPNYSSYLPMMDRGFPWSY